MKSLEIKTEKDRERFCIYEDSEDLECISILYVPNLKKDTHYHINLTYGEAKKLRDFLIKYFEDKNEKRNDQVKT